MKFLRVGEAGRERPVVEVGGRFYSLDSVASDINAQFWTDTVSESIAQAVATGKLQRITIEGERVGPPIARPSAVLGIGINYAAHAAESGTPAPTDPIVFLKTPNSIAGPYDNVEIPRGGEKTDWEVELGVVIGKKVSYLGSAVESRDCIAGFLVANDVSERAFQMEVSGGQWSKGKSAPGFCPIGPWLVTPDDVDYQNLRLQSWVNGEVRQDSSTADQIFSVDYVIWNLSQYLSLEPGDLILTGTPEGVGLSGKYPYLTSGDVVDLEIEGLGHQRQKFV